MRVQKWHSFGSLFESKLTEQVNLIAKLFSDRGSFMMASHCLLPANYIGGELQC